MSPLALRLIRSKLFLFSILFFLRSSLDLCSALLFLLVVSSVGAGCLAWSSPFSDLGLKLALVLRVDESRGLLVPLCESLLLSLISPSLLFSLPSKSSFSSMSSIDRYDRGSEGTWELVSRFKSESSLKSESPSESPSESEWMSSSRACCSSATRFLDRASSCLVATNWTSRDSTSRSCGRWEENITIPQDKNEPGQCSNDGFYTISTRTIRAKTSSLPFQSVFNQSDKRAVLWLKCNQYT